MNTRGYFNDYFFNAIQFRSFVYSEKLNLRGLFSYLSTSPLLHPSLLKVNFSICVEMWTKERKKQTNNAFYSRRLRFLTLLLDTLHDTITLATKPVSVSTLPYTKNDNIDSND